jgi:N-dimethylarginine dimethylaminohydrolase
VAESVSSSVGGQSEVGQLETVLLKDAWAAFESVERVAGQWRTLGWSALPDLHQAGEESAALAELLRSLGVQVVAVPPDGRVGMDSLYVRDAAVVCDRGAILCRMGKAGRAGEPEALRATFEALGVPIIGAIEGDGRLEGGDVVWLDDTTLAVGRGYRTNESGIRQLRTLLSNTVDDCIVVHLPHATGPDGVFHLMSVISPIDRDLAVVYSPLMSVPFRETLLARGVTLVEVPEEEYHTLGGNILAVAPRRVVMVAGNPVTRARLEAHDVEVHEISGQDIALKGSGGPTCLTRPVLRRPVAAG